MSLVFSHPTGNANVRAAASSLCRAGLLAEFHTSFAAFPGDLIDRLGALNHLSDIRRRQFDPVLKPLTKQWPWRELGRMAALRAGLTSLIRHETGVFCVDEV